MIDCNEQERQLLEMIDFLQKEYVKATKPYVDRLIAIRQRTITPQMTRLHLWLGRLD